MNTLNKVITDIGEGYELSIALNEQFAGVNVTSVSMFISKEGNEEDGYMDGDLAVNWEVEGLQKHRR